MHHRRTLPSWTRYRPPCSPNASPGLVRSWPSRTSTCSCCRWAPTCRTSSATRPCPSSGSTMLVLRARDGTPALVIPKLEAPRVVERPDVFEVVTWTETEDPVALVGEAAARRRPRRDRRHHMGTLPRRSPRRAPRARRTHVRRRSWGRCPRREGQRSRSKRCARGRRGRRRRGGAADRGTSRSSGGPRPRSAELGARMLAEGHHRVNFAIVAAGENAASPHHEAGHRIIGPGEVV